MSSLFRCSLALSSLCKSKSHRFYLQIRPGSDRFSPRQHRLFWATATVSHQATISALPSILHEATRGSQSNRRQIMALLSTSRGSQLGGQAKDPPMAWVPYNLHAHPPLQYLSHLMTSLMVLGYARHTPTSGPLRLLFSEQHSSPR